jgi:2-polyprenyl-6-methoxyphenol hydroxylase-like FAD-dependent oxidoreductase
MFSDRKEILITGAGPTGLTMANLLARMGIPFLLIDKNAQPALDSKAFGIHARTLEIFDQLGIAEKAVEQGNIENTLHIFIKKKEIINFRIKELLTGETKYPYFLILEQNKTEELLIESLEELGAKVNWQHELTGFKEVDIGVEATIRFPSGEEKTSEFQYLVGCDGADSTVRSKG